MLLNNKDISNITRTFFKTEVMEDFEWNVVNEGHLLDAMVGHKPIGINKHFQMAFICEKFGEAIKKDVPSTKIWSQLETMYNLEALNETETLPFPNEMREFTLPETDFGTLKRKKEKEEQEEKKTQKGRETPKNMKEIKKEDAKTPVNNRSAKSDTPRRDSNSKDKDNGKEIKTPTAKKEIKKEPEPKAKQGKGRNSGVSTKDDNKKNKREESPRPVKRPTRGSLKPDETNGGKASPLTVTPGTKRRRI